MGGRETFTVFYEAFNIGNSHGKEGGLLGYYKIMPFSLQPYDNQSYAFAKK